jgi:hypothetical protein
MSTNAEGGGGGGVRVRSTPDPCLAAQDSCVQLDVMQCGCTGKFADWLSWSLSVALEGVELPNCVTWCGRLLDSEAPAAKLSSSGCFCRK